MAADAYLRQQITDLCDMADQLIAQLNAAATDRRTLEAQLADCQRRIAELEAAGREWTAEEILRREG